LHFETSLLKVGFLAYIFKMYITLFGMSFTKHAYMKWVSKRVFQKHMKCILE